jgi:hypothetical protein
MIPRGASVGKIRREATKPVSTFAGRDESQERWKDGKAEAEVLSSKPNPPYCALAGSAYRSKAPVIGAKAVKPYLTLAIVVFAASPACAQAEPARAEKAYLHCLLAHTLDGPSGDEEKSAMMIILDKCAQELIAYMNECEATGATNCLAAAGAIVQFALRSTRK